MPFPYEISTPEADGAISRLQEAYDDLVKANLALAMHASQRPAVERAALSELMQQENPATPGKNWGVTNGTANLDLVPAFAKWRIRRNEMEAQATEAAGAVEVAKRLSDLHVSLVKAVVR